MALFITNALQMQADQGVVFPIRHSRFLIDNIITKDNLLGHGGKLNFPLQAIANPLTYDRWDPLPHPGSFGFAVVTDEPKPTDGLGIAGHKLGSLGFAVKWETRADIADPWDVEAEFSPGTDDAIFILTDKKTVFSRVTFTGFGEPLISVVYIGETIAMERPIYGGHTPTPFARVTDLRPNVSERGQWIGRSVINKGFSTEFAFQHLTDAWVRSTLRSFIDAARSRPFFGAWRPQTHPSEVGYYWTTGDIRASNMGIRDLMECTISVEGLDVSKEEGQC
jgi:hypothetical protein